MSDFLDTYEDIFMERWRPRNVYIAGRFDPEPMRRLRYERSRLEAAGHKVVSTWLDEEAKAPTPLSESGNHQGTEEEYAVYAMRDFDEIVDKADLLICDTFDDDPRGGRENEFGIALASRAEAWVVGPKRSVFHRIVPHFLCWDDVHAALAKGDA